MAERKLIKLGATETRARVFKTGEEALLAGAALKSLGANLNLNLEWEVQAKVQGSSYILGSVDAVVEVSMEDGRLRAAWQGSGRTASSKYNTATAATLVQFLNEFAPEQEPIVLYVDRNQHEVKFSKGSIQVGCSTIRNEIVREITERLID